MALADNKPRGMGSGVAPRFLDFPVKANTHIRAGSALSWDGTNDAVEPLVAASAFRGFAEEEVNNDTATHGAKRVRVRTAGTLFVSAITGYSAGDTGTVYMSDDETFTNVSAGNTAIGVIADHDGAEFQVNFEADIVRSL